MYRRSRVGSLKYHIPQAAMEEKNMQEIEKTAQKSLKKYNEETSKSTIMSFEGPRKTGPDPHTSQKCIDK